MLKIEKCLNLGMDSKTPFSEFKIYAVITVYQSLRWTHTVRAHANNLVYLDKHLDTLVECQ